jgi:hypothetical protein
LRRSLEPELLARHCTDAGLIEKAALLYPPDDCLDVEPSEALESKRADVGKTSPGRLELGSEGDQRQNCQSANPIDHKIQQLN